MSFAKSCSLAKNCKPLTAFPPRPVITWDKHERIRRHKEIWDNPESIVHRLPKHYQEHYWKEFVLADRPAVHYKQPPFRFYWDTKRKVEIETEAFPIYPEYCPEQDQGLWAGEGVVKGYYESNPFIKKKILPRQWIPKLWFPSLKKVLLYSEVLDQYMTITVTVRARRLIDQHFGLDLYLLETPDAAINSKLGMDLKRMILIKLAKGDYYPQDKERQGYIRDKYARFMIPLDQAEWYGLDLNSACRKLQDQEDYRRPVPLKYMFEKQLIWELGQPKPKETKAESKPKSRFGKVNWFQ